MTDKIKNIKEINLEAVDLKQILDDLNSMIEQKRSSIQEINQKLSSKSHDTISIDDFKNLPDIDLTISRSGKLSSSENDVKNMLKWIVIKSKIEELKNLYN